MTATATVKSLSRRMAEFRAEQRGKVGHPIWEVNSDFRSVESADTVEDAIKTGGLDWAVEKEQLHLADGTEVPEKYALVRTKEVDGKSTKVALGIVGKNYKPIQNVDKFNWFNDYLQTGKVKLVSAGSINDGEKVVVVAKLDYPDIDVVPGDTISKYLVLSDTFDGKTALKVSLMTLRLICANGMVTNETNMRQNFRHNSNTLNRMESLKNRLDYIDADFTRLIESYRLLAAAPIRTENQLTEYITQSFNFEPAEKDGKLMLPTRSANIVESVMDIHDKNKSLWANLVGKDDVNVVEEVLNKVESAPNNSAGIRGSYYAAFNAITEYLNHSRGHNHNTRLDGLLFGESNRIAHRAMDLAVQYANAA